MQDAHVRIAKNLDRIVRELQEIKEVLKFLAHPQTAQRTEKTQR